MSTNTLIRSLNTTFAVALCAVSLTSCADLARTGSGPSFLIMESMQASSGGAAVGATTPSLESDVSVDGTAYRDIGEAIIRVELKNQVSATAPTAINSVTLNRYRVRYMRTDGQNREGIDVPLGFEGAATQTINVGSSGVVQFDLVRAQAKLEVPLRTLVRGGGLIIISTIAEVTFYGRDQAGNDVSISGRIDVRFADF
jgi:hypothetical protein